jgi:Co/Zn/Cd efflux system component
MHFSVYIGGIISKSIAVITDAAHMAIDVASFLISLTAMYLARKRPTKRLSFGYIRAGLYILNYNIFIFLNYLLFRGTWSSFKCINNLVSYWSSCLHGY